MKKFFYLAVIALATVFASCTGGNCSDYYKDGKEPQVDTDKHTVNGKVYDDEKEQCWKVTVKTTILGVTGTADSYTWGTEFDLVWANEEAMYAVAKAGVSTASYKYQAAPKYKNSDDCLDANDD